MTDNTNTPDAGGRALQTDGKTLFCDLKTDEEKAEFFLSGRACETGIIAPSVAVDVALAYQRCATYAKGTTLSECIETLELVLRGLDSGHIKAKPIITFVPNADEMPVTSVASVIRGALSKAKGQA